MKVNPLHSLISTTAIGNNLGMPDRPQLKMLILVFFLLQW